MSLRRKGERGTLIPALAVAFFAVACSSDADCNAVGCTNGFEIHASAGAPLADGLYQLSFTIDDVSGACEFSLPSEAGNGCDPSLPASVTMTSTGFSIAIGVAAESVSVQIEHDDQVVASDVYQPSYRTTQLGSGDCEQTCQVADPEELTIEL